MWLQNQALKTLLASERLAEVLTGEGAPERAYICGSAADFTK